MGYGQADRKRGNRGKSVVKPTRIVSLAYEWFLAPIELRDYDFVLTLGCADSNARGVSTTTYHAKLPAKRSPGRQSDVSGNLGIVFQVADESAVRRASASERLIADALIWELAKLQFDDTETLLLVQGPLLPKFRGRVLYRGVPKNLTVWSLTWQPEWFLRLEASEQLLRNIKGSDKLSRVYPPKGLDRASRSWVWRSIDDWGYHFEVLTNTWDCVAAENWEDDHVRKIKMLVNSMESMSIDYPPLPAELSRAYGAARDASELERLFTSFLQHLREKKHKADVCREIPRMAQIMDCIDREMTLFERPPKIDWRDEETIYKAFLANGKAILQSLTKDAFFNEKRGVSSERNRPYAVQSLAQT